MQTHIMNNEKVCPPYLKSFFDWRGLRAVSGSFCVLGVLVFFLSSGAEAADCRKGEGSAVCDTVQQKDDYIDSSKLYSGSDKKKEKRRKKRFSRFASGKILPQKVTVEARKTSYTHSVRFVSGYGDRNLHVKGSRFVNPINNTGGVMEIVDLRGGIPVTADERLYEKAVRDYAAGDYERRKYNVSQATSVKSGLKEKKITSLVLFCLEAFVLGGGVLILFIIKIYMKLIHTNLRISKK